MKIIVVSKGPFDIYGGRPSIYGNPFKLHHEMDRDMVCDTHDKWLDMNPHLVEQMRQACIAIGKEEVRVKCFCAPKRCHLDNYAKRINRSMITQSIMLDAEERN